MGAVRIGALVPLSRPGWVEAGRQLLAGLELAVRDVSEDIELVVRDTAGDPARAAAAVDELAGLGVAALAGEYHSVVARAVAARADALGLPFVCSSAVLDALTDQPTDWVARIAPPQSRGWRIFADFLLDAGHTRVAVVADPSVYWASGIRILRDRLGILIELSAQDVCDELDEARATALLLLVGQPEPALSIVASVRQDPRLADMLIGAPAGQPEFLDAAGIPFLRYLPDQFTPLPGASSFVAYEGYDTILALAAYLRSQDGWSGVSVEGTRGQIRFTREPGISVWQWAWPPIQVVDRDPAQPDRFRVLTPAGPRERGDGEPKAQR